MKRQTKTLLNRLERLEVDAPPPGAWSPDGWKRAHDAGRLVTHPQQAAMLEETYGLASEQIFYDATYT